MKKIKILLFLGVLFFVCSPFSILCAQVVGDYGAISSGVWSNAGIWRTWNGSSFATVTGIAPSSQTANVFILPGSTVSLDISQTTCNNLTINTGGKLWTNSSGSNTYLYVYGNITCDGTIGNSSLSTTISGIIGANTITVGSAAGLSVGMNVTGTGIGLGATITGIAGTTITLSIVNAAPVSGTGNFILFDAISFGIEGSNCLFTGTGTVDASRIRKNLSTIVTTNLIIDININLRFATGSTTQIYNSADGSVFNVTLNAGKTLNLTTTSGYTGNVAMDGIYGNDPANRGGSYLIKGTMNISGSLYLTTNNGPGFYPCSFTIDPTGVVITPNVVGNNSGLASHTFTMNSGGLLQITGSPAGQFFFNINNIYNLNPGSTIEYSGTSAHIIDNNVSYANLKLSTGAVNKTALGILNVSGDITIVSPSVFVPNAITPVVNLGGNWNNYNSTGFMEGASTVNMIGASNQTITCNAGGEDFYKLTINKIFGKVILSSAPSTIVRISNTLDLTKGNMVTASLPGNYYVQIQNTATVINASDNSFVENSCARQLVNGSPVNFTFPVGKSGRYRPASIAGTPTANCLAFSEFYLADPNTQGLVTLKAPTLDHISRCEYWRIKQQGSAAAQNFIVTLSWPTYNNCFIVNNLSSLSVTSWSLATAGIWNDLGNLIASGTTAAGIIPAAVSSGLVSSALGTPFTLASTQIDNPLPIKLISFTADPGEHCVNTKWVTAVEIQNDYFTIQKSRNGKDFEDVINVEGSGTSSVMHQYYAIDKNPWSGISYYRLRQTDFDGQESFSDIIPVKFGAGDLHLFVYPNPASDILNVQFPGVINETARIEIINTDGRIVQSKQIENGSVLNFQLPVEDLASGIYFLVINGIHFHYQIPFIRK